MVPVRDARPGPPVIPGVALFQALSDHDWVTGGDGLHHPDRMVADHLSAREPGHDHPLTPAGYRQLRKQLGVRPPD